VSQAGTRHRSAGAGCDQQTLTDSARELRSQAAQVFLRATAALGGLFVLLLVIEFIQRGMVA
jgi:hypothetical protein